MTLGVAAAPPRGPARLGADRARACSPGRAPTSTGRVVLGKLDEAPFPSVADVAYLAGYVFVLAGVVALVRHARPPDVGDRLDRRRDRRALRRRRSAPSLLMDFVLENTTGTALEIAVAVALSAPRPDDARGRGRRAGPDGLAARPRARRSSRPGWPARASATPSTPTSRWPAPMTPTAWNNSLWPLATVADRRRRAADAAAAPGQRPARGLARVRLAGDLRARGAGAAAARQQQTSDTPWSPR